MENIEKILADLGLALTDEQKTTLDNKVKENYKTVADYDKQKEKLTKAETDLQKAQEDIKGIVTQHEGKTAQQWKKDLDALVRKNKGVFR